MRTITTALITLLVILCGCTSTGEGRAAPAAALHEISGSCDSDVDLVIKGMPARLSLRYSAALEGAGHTGKIDVVTPFGTLSCTLSGEARACSLAPGTIPFLPDPIETVDAEGGDDATE